MIFLKKPRLPERFWEDDEWIENNYSELVRNYKSEWIAVVNKMVVAHGKNLALVEEEAKLKTGMDHIPVAFIESGAVVY